VKFDPRTIISDVALADNRALHDSPAGFGGSGWKHLERVEAFAHELGVRDVLDYGCGECTLSRVAREAGSRLRVHEYDPAVRGRDRAPKPHDLVVCTDVLEHVEPPLLDNVLAHIRSLSRRGAYLAIATRPANKLLPDGRNAHLIVEDTPWWRRRVLAVDPGWRLVRDEDIRKGGSPEGAPHECRLWLRPAGR
jgi:methyltransferase family protein